MSTNTAIEIPEGTPFQQSVWKEIAKISPGTTITYTELAARVGNPRAYRAVATACGANPYPYPGSIPCHRVISSDGSLGGYSGAGGIETKRRLLLEEGVKLSKKALV